jgi:sialate O-acetylesterase
MFNAMLAPLIPYTIKGVIWYQGEANVDRAKEYQTLFPNMIVDWRKRFGQGDFPFLFVQLANFIDYGKNADWPALREAQFKTLQRSPNTAMAVTIDIGEAGDIHPRNKKDVGLRLALAAQKIAYKDNVVHSGPLYQSYKIDGNKIIIHFTNTGSGLMCKNEDLTQFEIAAADKKFVEAKAIIKGNTVIIWSDAVANPVAVRYAWSNSADSYDLYNKEGLPASPFRTSNW